MFIFFRVSVLPTAALLPHHYDAVSFASCGFVECVALCRPNAPRTHSRFRADCRRFFRIAKTRIITLDLILHTRFGCDAMQRSLSSGRTHLPYFVRNPPTACKIVMATLVVVVSLQ